MMHAYRAFLSAGVIGLVARLVFACATTDDTAPPEGDANAAHPDGDASVSDAADAEAPDASVDAQLPTCSADGWCYTSLPAKDSYDASAVSATNGARFSLRGVWGAPDHRVWSVSGGGHVLLWDGTSWQVKAVLPNGLRTIAGANATELWVGGEQGLVMRGRIAGADVTFEPATLDTTQTIARIVATSPTDVWAIADGIWTGGTLDRVFRLDPSTASSAPTFSAMTVPSTLGPDGQLSLSALWTSGTDVWIAGLENGCLGPDPCTFASDLVAMRWNGVGGDPSWEQIPFLNDWFNPIAAATATPDGTQLLGLMGDGEDALVARIAGDDGKLDASAEGGITHEGAYGSTQDFVDSYGFPADLWAASSNDVWLVGQSGLVRHFDGTSWKRIRTSLTSTMPLLQDLHGIHAVVDASGEQDIWIVGDDVALHKKYKP